MIVEIAMQRRKRERHPVRGQHLNVRQLRHAIRRERKGKSRQERAIVTARDREREKVRRESRQHEGQEERDVVPEQRVAGHQDHGRREDREAE